METKAEQVKHFHLTFGLFEVARIRMWISVDQKVNQNVDQRVFIILIWSLNEHCSQSDKLDRQIWENQVISNVIPKVFS